MEYLTLHTVLSDTTPRDYEADCLDAIIVKGKEARAQTRFLLTGWSKAMVHSAEVILPSLKLARHIDKTGIRSIVKASFRKPIQTELELVADEVHEPTSARTGDAFWCVIETNNGRHIEIRGVPTETKIQGGSWSTNRTKLAEVFNTSPQICSGDEYREGIPPLCSGVEIAITPGVVKPSSADLDFTTTLDMTLEAYKRAKYFYPEATVVSQIGRWQPIPLHKLQKGGVLKITCSALPRVSARFVIRSYQANFYSSDNQRLGGDMKFSMASPRSPDSQWNFAMQICGSQWSRIVKG